MKVLRRLDRALGRAYGLIADVVGISLGLFAIVISVDLLLRLLGIGNLPGMQELIEYTLYFGVFLAAPWALRLNAHVRIDLLLTALPRRARVLLERGLDMFGLIICCVIFAYAARATVNAYAQGLKQHSYYTVDEGLLLFFLTLGFALVGLEFVFRLLRAAAPTDPDQPGSGV
jgi:TRAP-type C4-dicarboxylate transport system permease small subunit